MTTRVYWLPAESLEGATRLAHAIDAKRLPMQPHYTTEEAATVWAAKCNEMLRHPLRVYAVVVERGSAPAPVSRIGWGDVAAAALLFVAAPMVMAAGWGI